MVFWNGLNMVLMIVISRCLGWMRMSMYMDYDDDFKLMFGSVFGGVRKKVDIKEEGGEEGEIKIGNCKEEGSILKN